tara:strand:+ start:3795 stop:4655 length:861 start_codon:yes stop_codon:yes gene_type:complete
MVYTYDSYDHEFVSESLIELRRNYEELEKEQIKINVLKNLSVFITIGLVFFISWIWRNYLDVNTWVFLVYTSFVYGIIFLYFLNCYQIVSSLRSRDFNLSSRLYDNYNLMYVYPNSYYYKNNQINYKDIPTIIESHKESQNKQKVDIENPDHISKSQNIINFFEYKKNLQINKTRDHIEQLVYESSKPEGSYRIIFYYNINGDFIIKEEITGDLIKNSLSEFGELKKLTNNISITSKVNDTELYMKSYKKLKEIIKSKKPSLTQEFKKFFEGLNFEVDEYTETRLK